MENSCVPELLSPRRPAFRLMLEASSGVADSENHERLQICSCRTRSETNASCLSNSKCDVTQGSFACFDVLKTDSYGSAAHLKNTRARATDHHKHHQKYDRACDVSKEMNRNRFPLNSSELQLKLRRLRSRIIE